VAESNLKLLNATNIKQDGQIKEINSLDNQIISNDVDMQKAFIANDTKLLTQMQKYQTQINKAIVKEKLIN